MTRFTDDKGREWSVELNVWSLKQVSERVGVLLTALAENNGELFARLYAEPILLCDVAWVLLQSQADERQIDCKQFCQGVLGDSLGQLRQAVLEATANFFDDPATRENMRAWMAKFLTIAHQVNLTAADKLEEIDTSEAAQKCTDYVMNGRRSPALNRGGSPAGN